jgi:hypothetical protein
MKSSRIDARMSAPGDGTSETLIPDAVSDIGSGDPLFVFRFFAVEMGSITQMAFVVDDMACNKLYLNVTFEFKSNLLETIGAHCSSQRKNH